MKKNVLSIAISLALLGGSSVVTADTTEVDVMPLQASQIQMVAFNEVAIGNFQNEDDAAEEAEDAAEEAEDAAEEADDAAGEAEEADEEADEETEEEAEE